MWSKFYIFLFVIFSALLPPIICKKPNILLIIADDLGWNDVDWHDPTLETPVLNRLAHSRNTVQLHQAYVNQVCSPTRSALLSGYYPYHLGTQHSYFHWMEPAGVPLKYLFIPEELATLGYNRYMVGKWHLGYCKHEFLPTRRGFEKFRGFYGGSEDYFTHRANQDINETVVTGYDLFRDTPHSFTADWSSAGMYSAEIFANETIELLRTHNSENPFFFYLAFQSVHSPLQVPQKYVTAKCAKIKRKARRIYCGMLKAMDSAIGEVVVELKRLGHYQNTIIIFTSDNGGQTIEGGNNYPLRGNKATLWEGGTRTNSFVHAPQVITEHKVQRQLFSVVDWYATILGMVGQRTKSYGDGLNQWPLITDSGQKKYKRTNFVYNYDNTGSGKLSAAIRNRDYKLIVGDPGRPDGWIPPTVKRAPGPRINQTNWLFNIRNDPTERRDLSKLKPLILHKMLLQMIRVGRSSVSSVHRPLDNRGNPKYFNGTFASGWC